MTERQFDELQTACPSNRPRRGGASRREFLRGLMVGSLGLPWLETFAPRNAGAQSALPTRFITMFSPSGTIYDQWLPSGEGTAFTLSPILTPLAPYQRDLVVIAGVDQRGAGGDGHQSGIGGMLTGAAFLPGRFSGLGSAPAGWCEGPSVDKRIADVIGLGSPLRSLELGVQVVTADNFARMIYRGRERPLAPREDPVLVFDQLFGGGSLDPAARAHRHARRQSVLDHVSVELGRLAAEVSADDRQRFTARSTLSSPSTRRTGGSCG